ncbi:unnamed protein product, partial [Symbiodinium necroappetens]
RKPSRLFKKKSQELMDQVWDVSAILDLKAGLIVGAQVIFLKEFKVILYLEKAKPGQQWIRDILAALVASQNRAEAEEESQRSPTSRIEVVLRLRLRAYLDKKDGPEQEVVKGGIELPKLPEPHADGGVEFQDWVYMTEQMVGSLTDKAGTWYMATLACAKEAFMKYQAATPLMRLSIAPVIPVELKARLWERLDRRVLTLILAAMPRQAKEDAVTHRVKTTADALFRLYVLYQPGSSAERAAVLKLLEGTAAGENVEEVVTALRRWKRHLTRAMDMGITPPDASIQLKAIDLIIARVIERDPGLSFRLSLARHTLQLQSRPTQETVLQQFYDHALAEIQQLAPWKSKTQSGQEATRLKALGTTAGTGEPTTPSSTSSPKGAGKGNEKTPCKFFASDAGCKKGGSCKFAHTFMSREDKKSRCWTCGARNHRQSDCPVKAKAKAATTSAAQPLASASNAGALLQEANAMLSKLAQLQPMKLKFKLERRFWTRAPPTPFGRYVIETTTPIKAELAGGQETWLRQTKAGTLVPSSQDDGGQVKSIVPLGALVQQLNCTLAWTKDDGLIINHPSCGKITAQTVGNCPVIPEGQALRLIAELEEARVNELEGHVNDGRLRILNWDLNELRSWENAMATYVATGKRHSGLEALMMSSSPFGQVDVSIRSLMVDDVDLTDQAGWNYLKAMPLRRAMRKRLHQTSWIVHLYAGPYDKKSDNLKVTERNGVTVLELDILRSSLFSLRGQGPAYKLLLWAVLRGQIVSVVGGPPWFLEVGGLEQVEQWSAYDQICEALQAWYKEPDLPRLARMLAKFEGNYDEMRHQRVRSPSSCVLSLDISGPYRTKGETGTRKDFRYVLVGAFMIPKMYKDLKEGDGEAKNEGSARNEASGTSMKEDFECSEYEPSEPGSVLKEGVVADADEKDEVEGGVGSFGDYEDLFEDVKEELDKTNKEFWETYKEVGDPFQMQVLQYAIPLVTRRSSEVNAAIRTMILKIKAEGFPVVRCHSDRARELTSDSLRAWLVERDILPTTGEGQAPQQNGRAEAVVKSLKGRAKQLLHATGLPRQLWPMAMTYAAFGGRHDLELRWAKGRYVGPAQDIPRGSVVRLDDGGYVTSVHLRPHLVDADQLVDLVPHEVDLDFSESVRARVKEKTTPTTRAAPRLPPGTFPTGRISSLRMKPLTEEEEKAESLAKKLEEDKSYGVDNVLRLYERLEASRQKSSRGGSSMWFTGAFVRGGKAGLRLGTTRMPWSTRYLIGAAWHLTGTGDFTAVGVARNPKSGYHKDSHNEEEADNVVVGLNDVKTGGGLWVQNEDLHHAEADWRQVSKKVMCKGEVRTLGRGDVTRFAPRLWHGAEPHEGDRYIMPWLYLFSTMRRRAMCADYNISIYREVLYLIDEHSAGGPLCLGDEHSAGGLKPVPVWAQDFSSEDEVQQPQARLLKSKQAAQIPDLEGPFRAVIEDQEDLIEELSERAATLRRLLEEEEILAEQVRRAGDCVQAEASHVRDLVEDMLDEVGKGLEHCQAQRELRCLKAIQAGEQTTEEPDYEALLEGLQRDLEVVYTVPLSQVKPVVERWRDAISAEVAGLFEGTLRSITIEEARQLEKQGRLKLVPSKSVCTLKPPSEPGSKKRYRRKYRLVICGNYIDRPDGASGESLYAGGASAESLRASLALAVIFAWTAGSSDIARAFLLAEWPAHMPLYGVFHHDYYYRLVTRNQAAKIDLEDGTWLVLVQSIVDPEVWLVKQRSANDEVGVLVGLLVTYVDDLLYLSKPWIVQKLHGWISSMWPTSALAWATDDEGLRYLGVEVRQLQDGTFKLDQAGYVKDVLRGHGMLDAKHTFLPAPKEWLDEAAATERAPEEHSESQLKHAQRVVGELMWLTMRTRPDLLFVTSFMASYATRLPLMVGKIGARVHSYLAATKNVTLHVQNRDDKAVQAATLLESVGVLLDEVAGGGAPGSWRTRHLRVRWTYLREKIEREELEIQHCAGSYQLADLATKVQTRVRTEDLMRLWGFDGYPAAPGRVECVKLALLLCILCSLPLAAAEGDEDQHRKDALPATEWSELAVFTTVVCIVAIVFWELIKFAARAVLRGLKSAKKERTRSRIRERAAAATEREFQ